MREIDKWNNLTNEIVEQWIRDYFDIEEGEELDWWWIADEVGGIFEFADMFISFSDVLNCYKHEVSKEQFHNWYYWCLDNQSVNISLAKFILSPEKRLEKEQESLEKSKNSCIFAEELFKQDLEQHSK